VPNTVQPNNSEILRQAHMIAIECAGPGWACHRLWLSGCVASSPTSFQSIGSQPTQTPHMVAH
jgi:hypothetical protein